MAMEHWRVEDGRGNVVEEGDRPQDPRKTRRRQYIAEWKALARDMRDNPGNYTPFQRMVMKLAWLMYEGMDD